MSSEGFFENGVVYQRERFQLKETVVTIIAEENVHIEVAKKEIQKCRSEIEQFIRRDRSFEMTLESYKGCRDGHGIIKKMCKSSEKLGVGPMSTVGGIIAECAVKAMISKGARHAVVDNGGDIALFSDKTANVGIYTGNKRNGHLAFQVLASDKVIGICTSSGRIGRALSFGNADAVATALGDIVNTKKDIKAAFKILDNIKEIIGAMIIIDNKIGLWGEFPEIKNAKVPNVLVTRGR